MNRKYRLLDLFCGSGGCAAGYARAGFEVVGLDHRSMPNYPFAFVRGDAMRPPFDLADFDAIHASPPCHAYTPVSGRARHGRKKRQYPDLVGPVREMLRASGRPYVIENVPGAPLQEAVTLCGSMFGLDVRRHRLFESSVLLLAPSCQHGRQAPRFRSLDSRQKTLARVVGVHGHHNYAGEHELRCRAMGISWMTPRELTQAIPPNYTEFIGIQLIRHLARRDGFP